MTVMVSNARLGQTEHWLTFDEFAMLAERGAFGDSRHLELMDGRIIDLAPISNDHAIGTNDLGYSLRRALEDAGLAADRTISGPVTVVLSPTRSPEPDAVVARRTTERWLTPADLELVGEVAVTSQAYDLGEKATAYAEAGIPEYWVIDRVAKRLHVMRRPVDGAYTDVPDPLVPGDSVAPLFAPNVAIPVADLL